jgi:hypothetical protein
MLALVSLDNRPCNVRFPQQIAAIAGFELRTPPDATLGFFNTPGRPDELARWLDRVAYAEALIVSIDMLAYGGLVASRKPHLTAQNALENLEVLRTFRQRHPNTPIYAFNVLMRLAITLDGDEAIAHYYNVMRYARLVDEAERFNSEYLREELRKVRNEIPPTVLNEYHAARDRNHTVNREMISWLSEGVFEYLLITQEDATEYGLHRREQDDLLKHVAQLGVEEKFSLHPGADEADLTLLARHWNSPTRFRMHWSSQEDSHRIAPFEDRPYDQALAQHIAAVRGEWLEESDSGEADFELFVNAPVGGTQTDEKEGDRAARAARLNSFARQLCEAIEAGKRVALCDVAFPNGGDNVLLEELEKRRVLGRLLVFGAWNTAGNTTGTVLAACGALKHANFSEEAQRLARQFLFERLVDDWYYQSRVRGRIEKTARELHISPLRMEAETAEPVEAQARRELRGFAHLLAQRHFQAQLQRCEVHLPWHRTFEVDLHAELA